MSRKKFALTRLLKFWIITIFCAQSGPSILNQCNSNSRGALLNQIIYSDNTSSKVVWVHHTSTPQGEGKLPLRVYLTWHTLYSNRFSTMWWTYKYVTLTLFQRRVNIAQTYRWSKSWQSDAHGLFSDGGFIIRSSKDCQCDIPCNLWCTVSDQPLDTLIAPLSVM